MSVTQCCSVSNLLIIVKIYKVGFYKNNFNSISVIKIELRKFFFLFFILMLVNYNVVYLAFRYVIICHVLYCVFL
jgi:hypothetical protein